MDEQPTTSEIDVEILDGREVIARWTAPRRFTPPERYELLGTRYDVYDFTGPALQPDGRVVFRIYVHAERSSP